MTPHAHRPGAEDVSLLGAALSYARRGWPVLALRPGQKVPAGKLVPHGLKDASTDPDVIAGWWASEPHANVGIRTGVGFDVLDVDVKHGAPGIRTLVDLLDENGCLPGGPCVATPSGGLHYFFLPTGLGNATSFLPGLDWRGNGGYVVAVPSTVDGKPYQWGLEPAEEALRKAPPWLLALLRRTVRTPSAPRGEVLVVRPSAYAWRALEAEVGRLFMAPKGRRNDALNSAAFSLGQLVGAGSLDVGEVVAALLSAALHTGLTEHEAERTIISGLSGGMRQPRRIPA